MKLTTDAKNLINGSPACQAELAGLLDVSLYSIQKYVRDNEENNRLTTVAALTVIKKHTKLKQSEILEPVKVQ